MTPDPDCLFCRKLADRAGWPAEDVVWNFPHSVALLGPWQFFTGYCVLVSREHASELSQLAQARAAFLDEMATLAEAIETRFRPRKLNYELLGNQVPHLHWHLFPRYADDPDRLRPVWFALEKADTDPAEKRRLETGTIPRAEAVNRLRNWLRGTGAPVFRESPS
jgi:diadenosine tetraphosphate (Ap4A) HIT family hydrolase